MYVGILCRFTAKFYGSSLWLRRIWFYQTVAKISAKCLQTSQIAVVRIGTTGLMELKGVRGGVLFRRHQRPMEGGNL